MKKSKLSNNNRVSVDRLGLFVYTVEEYLRVTKDLPIDWDMNYYKINLDKEYAAVNIRAMLLRKYITRKNSVWLKTVIEEAKDKLPAQKTALTAIYAEYIKVHDQQIKQILEDGTVLNLRQTFNDLVYGIFLHADYERIGRLMIANEFMKFYCIRQFVHSVETSVLKLNNFLIENGILPLVKNDNFQKAPVVAFLESNTNQSKEIIGYWSNLYGKMTKNVDIEKVLFENKSPEERQIMECSLLFLHRLESNEASLKDMENIVFQQRIGDWGDLSEARKFLKSIKNCGIATTVKFNGRKDVAYVKVLENVKNAFEIDCAQLIPASHITLIMDSSIKKWRVFGFGKAIDPYLDEERQI